MIIRQPGERYVHVTGNFRFPLPFWCRWSTLAVGKRERRRNASRWRQARKLKGPEGPEAVDAVRDCGLWRERRERTLRVLRLRAYLRDCRGRPEGLRR